MFSSIFKRHISDKFAASRKHICVLTRPKTYRNVPNPHVRLLSEEV